MNFHEDYIEEWMPHPPEKIIHKNLYYLDKIKEIELQIKWLTCQKFHHDPDIDDQLRADKEAELEDSLSWHKAKLKQINNRNKKFC